MKKKLTSLLAVLLVFSFAASASAAVARWSYLSTLGITLEEKDDGIQWGATAMAYSVQSVTAVKVDVKLQLKTSTGWLTVASKSNKESSHISGAGGTYTGNIAGDSYRVSAEVYIYDGSTELEHVGPIYEYLDT